MSTQDELDRRLVAWMTETASGSPPARRFEQAMEATARRRSRPRWLASFGSDWVGTAAHRPIVPAWPGLPRELVAAATVALLIAAAITAALLVGALLLRPDPLGWRLGSLAYAVDGDIYVTRAEGGPPVVVADGRPDGAPTYSDPHWSPDGRYLMYHEASATIHVVHVTDPDGHTVASFPGWLSTWAPDSSRIATWELLTQIDVRTPHGRLLTTVSIPDDLQGFGDQGPGWLPDGSAIRLPRYGIIREGNEGPQPWALPLDGAAPRRLSVEATGYPPAFSPDGTRIAIDADAGLVVTAADGTGARTLLTRPGSSAHMKALWSPGGDRIAVTWSGGGIALVQVVNATSGAAETIYGQVRLAGDPSEYGVVTAVDWSPDGQVALVVEGGRDAGGASVWSVLSGGSSGHVVVEPAASEGTDWRWVDDDVK